MVVRPIESVGRKVVLERGYPIPLVAGDRIWPAIRIADRNQFRGVGGSEPFGGEYMSGLIENSVLHTIKRQNLL